MRAKQSSTATKMYSHTGAFTAPIPIRAVPASLPPAAAIPPIRGKKTIRGAPWAPRTRPSPTLTQRELVTTRSGASVAQRQGLAHDARNMMSALGLYCDLLSLPGVLKPQHRHYADDLRLVSTRSGTLMDRLMLALRDLEGHAETVPAADRDAQAAAQPAGQPRVSGLRQTAAQEAVLRGVAVRQAEAQVAPVCLRATVERCSGLLSRVADGRTIELTYGPAASMPVLVIQEDVERILVNLVRNAAVALDRRDSTPDSSPDLRDRTADAAGPERRKRAAGGALGTVRQIRSDRGSDQDRDAVRIALGLLPNAGDPAPWPFLRLRLTVEDSGCGMDPEQLARLLRGGRSSRASRGIGFQVVQELAAASGASLRVMSATGVGTRVQLEWPVAMPDVTAPDREKSSSGLESPTAPSPPGAASAGARSGRSTARSAALSTSTSTSTSKSDLDLNARRWTA